MCRGFERVGGETIARGVEGTAGRTNKDHPNQKQKKSSARQAEENSPGTTAFRRLADGFDPFHFDWVYLFLKDRHSWGGFWMRNLLFLSDFQEVAQASMTNNWHHSRLAGIRTAHVRISNWNHWR